MPVLLAEVLSTSSFPYSVEDVRHLCPECIASGEAAKKFDAQFVQDAEWEGEVDVAKSKNWPPRKNAWLRLQGEHWRYPAVMTTAHIWGQSAQELKEMGISATGHEEYEMRHECTRIKGVCIKDEDLAGMLSSAVFTAGKYHIIVRAEFMA